MLKVGAAFESKWFNVLNLACAAVFSHFNKFKQGSLDMNDLFHQQSFTFILYSSVNIHKEVYRKCQSKILMFSKST